VPVSWVRHLDKNCLVFLWAVHEERELSVADMFSLRDQVELCTLLLKHPRMDINAEANYISLPSVTHPLGTRHSPSDTVIKHTSTPMNEEYPTLPQIAPLVGRNRALPTAPQYPGGARSP